MARYCRLLAIYTLLILLVTALASYLLDPLGYFRINNYRASPLLGDNVWGDDRPIKALAIPGVKAETLLLGNSRVAHGFDVSDTEIQKHIGDAYNLALSGASIDDIDKFTRYALKYNIPSNIIFGLDLGQFKIPSEQSLSALSRSLH